MVTVGLELRYSVVTIWLERSLQCGNCVVSVVAVWLECGNSVSSHC